MKMCEFEFALVHRFHYCISSSCNLSGALSIHKGASALARPVRSEDNKSELEKCRDGQGTDHHALGQILQEAKKPKKMRTWQ